MARKSGDLLAMYVKLKLYGPWFFIFFSDFPFGLVRSMHPSNNKLSCCDFSSQGKFLAAAGHEKKVTYYVHPESCFKCWLSIILEWLKFLSCNRYSFGTWSTHPELMFKRILSSLQIFDLSQIPVCLQLPPSIELLRFGMQTMWDNSSLITSHGCHLWNVSQSR